MRGVVFLELKDGSGIVENHGDVSHLRLKALVHLDVLAGPSSFSLSPVLRVLEPSKLTGETNETNSISG